MSTKKTATSTDSGPNVTVKGSTNIPEDVLLALGKKAAATMRAFDIAVVDIDAQAKALRVYPPVLDKKCTVVQQRGTGENKQTILMDPTGAVPVMTVAKDATMPSGTPTTDYRLHAMKEVDGNWIDVFEPLGGLIMRNDRGNTSGPGAPYHRLVAIPAPTRQVNGQTEVVGNDLCPPDDNGTWHPFRQAAFTGPILRVLSETLEPGTVRAGQITGNVTTTRQGGTPVTNVLTAEATVVEEDDVIA